jgi:hypothetical protein
MIQQEIAPRRSWFMVVTFLAFLIIGGFSVYFEIQESKFHSELAELKVKKESLEKTNNAVEANPATLRSAAVSVKNTLKKIEAEQLPWSKMIEKIEGTIPKKKGTNEPLINFRSYLGSTEGKISVSATTRSSSEDPFADIASLIAAFAAEPSFQEVFVPSITKSLAPEGEMVLSFSLNFQYQKPTF